MHFHDVTLTAAGEIHSRRQHESSDLVRRAVDLFSGMLAKHDGAFRAPIEFEGLKHIEFSWTPDSGGVAMVTFFAAGKMATTSLLLTGGSSQAESSAIAGTQKMIDDICSKVKLTPQREIETITERPAIISIPWPVAGEADLAMVADMETCLAAAFFERSREAQ